VSSWVIALTTFHFKYAYLAKYAYFECAAAWFCLEFFSKESNHLFSERTLVCASTEKQVGGSCQVISPSGPVPFSCGISMVMTGQRVFGPWGDRPSYSEKIRWSNKKEASRVTIGKFEKHMMSGMSSKESSCYWDCTIFFVPRYWT
jgi:hypothetical protein